MKNEECDCGDGGGHPPINQTVSDDEVVTNRIVGLMTNLVRATIEGEHDVKVVREMAYQMVFNLLAFAKKHQDYGRGNIAQGGEVGLLIRMNDKIQRMANLHHSAATPNHEGMTDSVNDLAIYGTIMQLVRRGEWPGTDERWAL